MTDVILLLAKIVGALAAIITGSLVIYLKVIKPIYTYVLNYFGKIDKILNELTTNGGQSIKDAIKRIENNLSLMCEENKIILDYTPISFWKFNGRGECIWVNQNLKDLTGYDNEDYFDGYNWFNLIHKDDRVDVIESVDLAVKHKRSFKVSFRIVKLNNEIITVSIKNTAIIDRQHNLEGYLGSVTQIVSVQV